MWRGIGRPARVLRVTQNRLSKPIWHIKHVTPVLRAPTCRSVRVYDLPAAVSHCPVLRLHRSHDVDSSGAPPARPSKMARDGLPAAVEHPIPLHDVYPSSLLAHDGAESPFDNAIRRRIYQPPSVARFHSTSRPPHFGRHARHSRASSMVYSQIRSPTASARVR
jgi:hypothetical protein